MFGRMRISPETTENGMEKLRKALDEADTVIIGAGSGLSTAAGYTYSGERFNKYFSDFAEKYHIQDMYSGGFYPFPDMETYWAWWSRHIWANRYVPIPNDTYDRLYDLVKDKDYFVLTTNVDHCFQRSGFDKKRLFYTQGDYGLLQSSNPHGASAHKTYDNEEICRKMLLAQGFEIGEDNSLIIPEGAEIKMRIPTELVPYCPDDGELMTTNLRADDTFVEDDCWHKAAERYSEFLRRHEGTKTVFLETAVGFNTPGIIKYPFWRMTAENPKAVYVCLNQGQAFAPDEIRKRSICMDGDLKEILADL
ncbi:MAG: Sir2 silent information regulator family NAD-dependent deacetylase [Eubacterium sp.]|nr:Sir2 silent information regulator family NAD-dependent deacetylase [Eubacterium sp.]